MSGCVSRSYGRSRLRASDCGGTVRGRLSHRSRSQSTGLDLRSCLRGALRGLVPPWRHRSSGCNSSVEAVCRRSFRAVIRRWVDARNDSSFDHSCVEPAVPRSRGVVGFRALRWRFPAIKSGWPQSGHHRLGAGRVGCRSRSCAARVSAHGVRDGTCPGRDVGRWHSAVSSASRFDRCRG